ncbi:uncharacterized protein L3040_001772 [Drepanopeziza brunnea f. sp. 'multigermtubi']|nr:hypothetical protein L3040_001772 [Drepanopeziza brunnea f. sp. 'multigermtubi']
MASHLTRSWERFRQAIQFLYRDKLCRWVLAGTSAAVVAVAVGLGSWLLLRQHNTRSIVDLGYSIYEGVKLDSGVDRFLGMRYAASPVGDLRFRAPVKAQNTTGMQAATAFGPLCLSTGVYYPMLSDKGEAIESEDCLFINVWKPASATSDSKLPVWVYIQGGGYAGLSNANYEGSTVVAASGHNIVVVNFNYRASVWGFLASEKVRADGDLNVGLLDQRRALEWVQENIHHFGGDPKHVVAHGVSAGAGSLAFHLTAYGGRNDDLFVGAIFESPFVPTNPKVLELEWQFDRYVNATGCAEASDQMACMRSKSTATLQAANRGYPYPGRITAPRFYWTPTIDGEFIQDFLSNMIESGKFSKVPAMVGDDTNEGSSFATNATSPGAVAAFFQDNYPKLNDTDTAAINAQYPLMPPLPRRAAYYPSLSAAYGEAAFTCPGNHLSGSFSAYTSPTNVWNYRYNVLQEDNVAVGLGVPHTFESPAIWGVGSTGSNDLLSSYTTYNKDIVPVVMHYWISFVRSLDPNMFRYEGAPEWGSWGNGSGQRLVLETKNTRMEDLPEDQVRRCEFWRGLADTLEH